MIYKRMSPLTETYRSTAPGNMYAAVETGLAIVPMRYVMTLLSVFLTIIGSTMKYAIGIAITEMVIPPESYMVNVTVTSDPSSCPYNAPLSVQKAIPERVGLYDWSETTQGLIFGALYWSYVTLQIPLGLAVERVGPRYILGFGVLLSNVCYLLTPIMVTQLDAVGFMIIRFITGAGVASIYPSLNVILAKWAPPSEKSKLGSIIYAGENLGFIFSMAMSGMILGSSKGNWPLLFYIYGCIGMVWLVLWVFLGYDDPSSHPFISAKEKLYLESCMAQKNTNKQLAPTPWLAMAKSLPLWGTLIAQIGHDWGLITIVTELPKYMKTVLHHEIQANGLLTAIPYAAMTIVAVVSGWFSDWLLYKNYLSITVVRKLFTTVSAVGPSLGVLAAMYAGCDSTLVIIMFTLGMAFMGFYYPSLSVNTLDLSPNYSGTLMGVIAFGGLGGIFSPYLTGVLAPQGTMVQWKSVFWVAVCALVLTNTFYLVVGSGEVQPWNSPDECLLLREPQKRQLEDRTQDNESV